MLVKIVKNNLEYFSNSSGCKYVGGDLFWCTNDDDCKY